MNFKTELARRDITRGKIKVIRWNYDEGTKYSIALHQNGRDLVMLHECDVNALRDAFAIALLDKKENG